MGVWMTRAIALRPEDLHVKTSEVDQAGWNYKPLLGLIQRRRFVFVDSLRSRSRYRRVLEIGYGSGVFMPHLAQFADEVYGIDPHPKREDVAAVLVRAGIDADLRQVTAEALPYPDGHFDLVVSVSTLEFSSDPMAACREILRVLAPDGELLVVTPGSSPLVDTALRLATGEDPGQYADRRERLRKALEETFAIDARKVFPPVLGSLFRL